MWLSRVLIAVVRLLVGATARGQGSVPSTNQRIYFANHSSHMDTVALWAALPEAMRLHTRPVAAADYWGSSAARRYLALRALNAVLIERNHSTDKKDTLRPLIEALEQGHSLIIFPEGTRTAQALPGPFKSGLFNLAMGFPNVELIPVYLENLHRCMPKGTFFPVPLICTVRFGTPLVRIENEGKTEFLERARGAVLELA